MAGSSPSAPERPPIAWLLLVLVPMTVAYAQLQPFTRSLVLTGVTVIDVRDGQPRPDTTIVVVGNRISALGNTGDVRLPPDARTINGSGKYLIPGLWDMHAHLGGVGSATEIDMPLLVANGVTGIREMWSDCYPVSSAGDCLEQKRTWQRQIEAGELVGPRLLALASWPVNGPRGLPAGALRSSELPPPSTAASWPATLRVAKSTS